MPEDTRARNVEALTADQLLAQARITADENRRQFRYVLDRFADGLLFYYFGHVDQVSHVMWRSMDPDHPAYTRGRRGLPIGRLATSTSRWTGSSARRWRSSARTICWS